ncbi:MULTISPECIES: MBL fold metallo-hydrolase [unclassified Meiothermus]|uniref:MBL fold metallo-hydrolase n=1 Tax=unclassified Meiothermus TaxID=370471 RepID=UPI000D7C245C|nr:MULTISPECIES: MBL fold metallo-hydrolase [unclassified Meiothermus]PZA06448.1 MBL fold metallo-hydrolase [Meiothermus sp. Pnk-1]RYM36285.1 MBL fold metallo-hydrolase [Meiothermus sp. PNK-Is4]
MSTASGIEVVPVPIPYPFQYVNCYLLLGDGAVLVDCALDTPEARGALEAGLARHGLKFADLDRLVLTHHHPDHYGLAGLIEAEGVPVYLLDVELERGHPFWSEPERMAPEGLELFRRHGVPEETLSDLGREMEKTHRRVHPPRTPQTFRDGEVLELAGERWRAVWTPGHADGHAMLLRESDGVLLAGDHVLERISPNIGRWAYSYPNPLGLYLESLERAKGLEVSLALPGHYRPLKNFRGRIEELAAHHQERLDQLLKLMNGRPQTCWELSLKLFPGELSVAQRRFAWAETLAHLEYLHLQGDIHTQESEGMVHYLL